MNHKQNIVAIIRAAGDGKRMQSVVPKVLHKLHNKALVEHVIDNVKASGVCEKPTVVVSPKHTQVQEALGQNVEYVVQEEQLGTGHAVKVAESAVRSVAPQVEHVVVFYGDMPFLSSASIKEMVERHMSSGAAITLLTACPENFEDWRSAFAAYGRIVRDERGVIERIVEFRDASEVESQIKEVNTGFYCFRADWLWAHLKQLKNNNNQSEYYLTDLIQMAIEEGEMIGSMSIDMQEAYGINSSADLAFAERYFTHSDD